MSLNWKYALFFFQLQMSRRTLKAPIWFAQTAWDHNLRRSQISNLQNSFVFKRCLVNLGGAVASFFFLFGGGFPNNDTGGSETWLRYCCVHCSISCGKSWGAEKVLRRDVEEEEGPVTGIETHGRGSVKVTIERIQLRIDWEFSESTCAFCNEHHHLFVHLSPGPSPSEKKGGPFLQLRKFLWCDVCLSPMAITTAFEMLQGKMSLKDYGSESRLFNSMLSLFLCGHLFFGKKMTWKAPLYLFSI